MDRRIPLTALAAGAGSPAPLRAAAVETATLPFGNDGGAQSTAPRRNPVGYRRNAVETTRVRAA